MPLNSLHRNDFSVNFIVLCIFVCDCKYVISRQVKDIRRRMQDFDKENVEVQREIGKTKNEIAALNRATNTDIINLATRLNEALNKVHYHLF